MYQASSQAQIKHENNFISVQDVLVFSVLFLYTSLFFLSFTCRTFQTSEVF
jgi:hypothetical protein